MLLGVNIDHIATLRNARGGLEPNLIQAALLCEKAGADGITVHLREDRRHTKDNDVTELKNILKTRLNLEMALTDEMQKIALCVKPENVCLVPENRQEVTTEGGLDVASRVEFVTDFVKPLVDAGIVVSLFIDADKEQVEAAAKTGTAKKLSNFKNWAVKTGTSGAEDGSNTDAWCVSYSNDYTVCAWIGNTSGDSNNNLTKSQNGGSLGANYCKIAMSKLPAQAEFEQPSNIETINLDNIELSNNQKLLLASPNLPERYIIQEKFNKKYAPTKTSKNYKDLTPTTLSGKIDGEKVKLKWKTKPLITYELYGQNSRIEQKIASFNEDTSNFEYVNTPKFDTFYIVSKYENSDLSVKSNELKFYLSKTDEKQGLKQIVKHWFY